MFETIFSLRSAHTHRLAPLFPEREEFLVYLQRRGTGRNCLRIYASRLNQIVRFLKLKRLRRVRPCEIKNAARRWANYRGEYRHVSAGPWSAPTFVWLAKRWLRFHGKLASPCRKLVFADKLKEYAKFMESEREFSPVTARGHVYQTGRFLQWCAKSRPKRQLSEISLSDVDRYFSAMASRWGKVSLSSCAVVLRSFFLYAESRRWCSTGIAHGIKGPPIRVGTAVPDAPKWKDVLRLLHTSKGRTPVAIRASAILLLLSFYGLRRSEIIRLQLSDFDWRNGFFTVRRSKRGGLQQFPLSREVSDSVLRYIRRARPGCPCKHLFVSFHPPFGPMHPTSINEIVSLRLKRLNIRGRHHGPHSLRHACATELLRRGTSLREIADFLGHRTCQSVGIYAKFDLQTLHKVSDLDLTGAL